MSPNLVLSLILPFPSQLVHHNGNSPSTPPTSGMLTLPIGQQTIYQIGVFISRSSLPFLRLPYLYSMGLLQCLNLVLVIFQALYMILPSIYLVFALIFWEGLLGGLVYVNTYAKVSDEVPEAQREFALGAVSVSDSAGISLAALVGVVGGVEEGLCGWQVGKGRDWCRRL